MGLNRSPSNSVEVGGRGRFGSGESCERWRVRGDLFSALGERSDAFEALRDGGPTKSAGAGRRLGTWPVLLGLGAMVQQPRRAMCN